MAETIDEAVLRLSRVLERQRANPGQRIVDAAHLEGARNALYEAGKEVERLQALLNTPVTADWPEGVRIEAAHQRERWGADHDAGKSALDWFWLIGYLAQKAAYAQLAGDTDKALHHTISTGAALLNWHAAISGQDTHMRPGIGPGSPAHAMAANL